jgi:hypothetical protein
MNAKTAKTAKNDVLAAFARFAFVVLRGGVNEDKATAITA